MTKPKDIRLLPVAKLICKQFGHDWPLYKKSSMFFAEEVLELIDRVQNDTHAKN